jgi:RHS repeat-associated protein
MNAEWPGHLLVRTLTAVALAGSLGLIGSGSPAWAGHAPTPGGPPPSNPPPPPPPGCGQNVCCKTGGGGMKVDFWNGREYLTQTDLSLPGLMPIVVQRSYDSQAKYDSALGYGWALNYFMRLYEFGDGSVILRRDCGVRRGFVLVGGAYQTPVGETGVLVKNGDGSWTYTETSGEQLRFDASGRLTAMVAAAGPYLRFSYDTRGKLPLIGLSPYAVDTTPKEIAQEHRLLRIEEVAAGGSATGRYVDLSYDEGTGRLTGLSDSAGRSVAYEHDGVGNLTQVSLPEGGELNYAYEDPRDPHNATTLTNSGCSSCGGFAYELTYDAQDRVIREQVGHNAMRMTYAQAYARTIIDEDVADADGNPLYTATRTYEFNMLGNPTKITDPLGNQRVFVYDANMNVVREERWENAGSLVLRHVQERTYDARGNLLTVTQAKGTPQQRVTTYTYDAGNRLVSTSVPSVVNPAQARRTTLTYDAQGNVLTEVETGLLASGTPYSYTTSYSYDANGRQTSVDGPRTDVSDVTTSTYDAAGNLATVTQPGSLTTTYSNYTAYGQPQTVTDPNGVASTYTYDLVGHVRTVTVAGGTTTYAYTSSGQLASITQPRGNITSYIYDALDRLASIHDGLGNSIHYTYDSAGNQLREDIKDPAAVLQKTVSYQYDQLRRPFRVVNPDTTFTEYGYDYAGSRTRVLDPRGNTTTHAYDALSRLVSSTQPGSVVTSYAYNLHDDLVTLTDPEGHPTTYVYDDLGRVAQETAPDTGTTTYAYDAASNRTSKTDARGVSVTYEYDALNRLLRVDFPSDTDVIYTYDTCPNGKGRLCRRQDHAGTTDFAYNARGQVAQETRAVLGITYTTAYAYDSNGNLTSLTYPSGRTVGYTYDLADRVSGVSTTPAGGGAQAVATAVTHKPYGGLSSLVYGSGLARTVSYDLQYRITGIQTPAIQGLAFGHDPNGNVTAITNSMDASRNKAFDYDALDRLATASGPWGALGWTYDRVGNRLTQTAPEGGSTYAYQAGTNHLSSVSGPSPLSFGYDANGNTATENARSFTYNQNNRLIQAAEGTLLGEYVYDAEEHRVVKTVGGEATVFHHDSSGQLLGEATSAGAAVVDYIYLDGEPLAKAVAASLSFIHADHLGTPQVMTDGAGGRIWEIEARPFGDGASIAGAAALNLRFPGQYLDQETGYHQNWHRDYAPGLGRYLEADPSGLRTSLNLYVYADDSPVTQIDPLGLAASFPPVNPQCAGKIGGAVYVICCASGGGIGICKGPEPTPKSSHVNDCMIKHEEKHITDLNDDIFPCDKSKCKLAVQLHCAVAPGNKKETECSGHCAELVCLQKKPRVDPEVRKRITKVQQNMNSDCKGKGKLGCVGP